MDTNELQKALFVRLGVLIGGICTVYDDVPQDPNYPYVYIGEDIEEPFDADDIAGRDTVFTLHYFSRYAGNKELRTVMDTAKEGLHDQNLTVTGQRVVLALWEYSSRYIDPDDGVTRHGAQRFRFITL